MPVPDYDVYLGAHDELQGYRVRQFVRDSAPLVSARFSTGAPGQTDLDLLKSAAVETMGGGMFQRTWPDVNTDSVARAIGIFNKYDENVYPAPARSSETAITSGYSVGAKVESQPTSFIAYQYFTAGTWYNKLNMITPGGGVTAITLPALLVNNNDSPITSLCLHKKYLYVASGQFGAGEKSHRYDIDADTWQNIGGEVSKFFTVRNQLYSIGGNSEIYSIPNDEASTITYTVVGNVGSKSANNTTYDVCEFNGAAWIAKPDGIWRFDGARAIRVLNLVTQQIVAYQGAMYFFSGNWLYTFDGVNVRRLQFFGSGEPTSFLSLSVNNDFLFFGTIIPSGSGYQSGDKTGVPPDVQLRVYTYDGVGFMLLDEFTTNVSVVNLGLVTNANQLYVAYGASEFGMYETSYISYNLDSNFVAADVTSSFKLEFTTSEFDDGFPNIFKSLEQINVDYSNMQTGDSIAVKYQLYDGKDWSEWHTLGTITPTGENFLDITDNTKKLFKRAKFNVTATLSENSPLSIKGGSIRYTLQPRLRWRWQVSLIASGNSETFTRNRTAITNDSNDLTNKITKGIKEKTPIYLLAPDYGRIKTEVNSSALTFIVKGQPAIYEDPYNEYPLIAVLNASDDWEILRVSDVAYNSGTDETTITVLERGYLGITAATLEADAQVNLAYRVYITRLLRDAAILDENTYAEQTTGESQIQREYLLEITEV